MKTVEVRVSSSLETIVYYQDKPYEIDNVSFVRDENHNCQMIVYATMIPLDTPPRIYASNSVVDDMEAQLDPDRYEWFLKQPLICDHCDQIEPECTCGGFDSDSLYG